MWLFSLHAYAQAPSVPDSTGKNVACPVAPGTFERRKQVELLWVRDRLDQEKATKRLAKIDAQYNALQHVLSRAYFAGEPKLQSMCAVCAGDPIADTECALLKFRLDPQRFRDELIGPLQAEQSRIRALAIAQYPTATAPREIAKAFAPEGPASLYIQILLGVAKTDDEEAFLRLFACAKGTEGELGEEVEDKLAQLWAEHPQLYAKNWTALSGSPTTLQAIALSLSPEQGPQLLRFARRQCTADAKECQNMAKLLSEYGPQKRGQ